MRRVLLVEDHAAFRQALATLLNMQSDLEVVDVFLPDGNGVELVRELRQADSRLPIVILTAGVDPKLHALAFEAGADEVCLKAAGVEEVVKAIHRASPLTDEEEDPELI